MKLKSKLETGYVYDFDLCGSGKSRRQRITYLPGISMTFHFSTLSEAEDIQIEFK